MYLSWVHRCLPVSLLSTWQLQQANVEIDSTQVEICTKTIEHNKLINLETGRENMLVFAEVVKKCRTSLFASGKVAIVRGESAVVVTAYEEKHEIS